MGAAPCYIQALPVIILAAAMCDALGQTQSIGIQDARLVHMQDRANPRPRCAMSETYQDIVARLPSETEIIRRLIHGLRRKRLLQTPLWRRFSDATAHGRGFSVAICARYGFDPDELELPPSAHLPSGPLID